MNFNLTNEGHLLCYPLEEFKSIDGIEGMILSLEKDGRFPSRDRVKRLFFRTYILSHSNATVTDKEYIRCVNLINEVYASNGWT